MHPVVSGSVAAALLASVAACVFDPSVPDGARISCTSSADCPDGDVCVGVGVGTCVAPDDADREGPTATDISMTPSRLSRDDVLTLSFDCSEPLTTPPVIQIGAASAAADGLAGPFSVDVEANAIGTGPQRAVIVLQDTAGNVGTTIGPPIEVDVDPPGVVPGSAQVILVAPPYEAEPATALVLYGSVEVTFAVDDELEGLPLVRLVGATTSLPLALISALGRTFRYEARIDSPLAPGSYAVRAEMVDDFANVGTVELGDVDVVSTDAPLCIARHADGALACADGDGDGFLGVNVDCTPTVVDCDDEDALVHSGALDVPGDGVDGDCTGGDPPASELIPVYVTADAAPGATGTAADPMTLLDAADAPGATILFVAAGTYPISVVAQFDDRHVIGGLDPSTWQPAGTTTLVSSAPVTDPAVRISGVGRETRISGLTIQSNQCEALSILSPVVSDTPLWVVDVTIEQTLPPGCAEASGVIHSRRPSRFVRLHLSMNGEAPSAYGVQSLPNATERVGFLDSSLDLQVVGAATAVFSPNAAPFDFTRTNISVVAQSFGSGVDVDGPLSMSASRVVAEGGNAQGVENAQSAAYTHVSIAVTAQNIGAGLLMNGQQDLLLLASVVDVTAGVDARGAMIAQTTLLSVGNAWRTDAPTACTVFRGATNECFSFADLQACAFLGCGASQSDVLYDGTPAPSVAVLDRGAPPAAFVDTDGDCRLATEVEAGADEQP